MHLKILGLIIFVLLPLLTSFPYLSKEKVQVTTLLSFPSEQTAFVYTLDSRPMNREALLKESKKVRDIARYLGSAWPIKVPVIDDTHFSSEANFISGYIDSSSVWQSLSSGNALNLIVKEIETIDLALPDPSIDFTIEDRNSGEKFTLREFPLNGFCRMLNENLRDEYSR